MNYILLVNPDEWTKHNLNDFDKKRKIFCPKDLIKAEKGDKVLLVDTRNYIIRYEAIISSFPGNINDKDETELSYIRTFKYSNLNILKSNRIINDILFMQNGDLKYNSLFEIDEFLYDEIIYMIYNNLNANKETLIEGDNYGVES